MRKYFAIMSFCLMTLYRSLFSQIFIEGVVINNGSEPLANALVELMDQVDTNRKFSDYTNEQGEYSIEIDGTGVYHSDSQNPGAFILFQNYPNPFNPSTVISYELSRPALVRIDIHNLLGRKVRTLFDGFQSNQTCQVIWDGTDDMGQGVPAGIYIYSLNTEGRSIHKKMLLMDGHQGDSRTTTLHATGTDGYGLNMLRKSMSNLYQLRVTGENIETYEQRDLEITGNTVLNITVIKTVTDIDGNVYKTIKIGDQWWMMENLKVTRYRNGDEIPNVTDNTEWSNLTTDARCDYENNESNVSTYGRLYNWYAVNDSRNIAPAGWYVPKDTEWQILVDYLGGDAVAGGKLKETGTSHWQSPNTDATNESGFTGLPGGYRYFSGSFKSMGNYAFFWSSTEYGNYFAWRRALGYYRSDIYRYYYYKQFGFSIRCVRDN